MSAKHIRSDTSWNDGVGIRQANNLSELDKLDYAFEKAFNIDFSEMRTPHGTTPAEVYRELLVFANEPQNLSYCFQKWLWW